jgi:hypothetical protein
MWGHQPANLVHTRFGNETAGGAQVQQVLW